jgi:hypothetical protein
MFPVIQNDKAKMVVAKVVLAKVVFAVCVGCAGEHRLAFPEPITFRTSNEGVLHLSSTGGT